MLLSHLYLSVTPRTCSSVTLSSFTRNLLTRLLVNLSTCPVTPRTCSSVTLSSIPSNLFTRQLSTCQLAMLLPELVHLLPCLLTQATCSPVNSSILLTYIVTLSLVNLVTKKTEERQLYRYLRITIVSRR